MPRSPLPFVMATLFLDALGIGLAYPVMPALIAEVRGVGLGGAAVWGGVLGAVYALMQFLCAPVLGALSDRWGRPPVLLVSLGVMALDYVALAVAHTIWLLLALRVIAGVTAATHATCNAVMADVTPPEDRAAVFGLLGAAFMAGFALGPVIGGALGDLDPRAPFWAAAAMAGLNLLFGWRALPETVTDGTRRPFALRRANPFAAFRAVGRLGGVAPLLGLLFLTELAFVAYVAVWAYWGQAAFGWSGLQTGLSLGAFALAAIWSQGYGIRLYLRLLGERGTILMGFASSGVFFLLFALLPPTPTGGLLAILLCPLSALGEVILPALQARISRQAPPEAQGEALGVVASTRSAAQVGGPILMSALFWWGASQPGGHLYGAPYLLGAALMLLCLLLFRPLPEPAPKPAPEALP